MNHSYSALCATDNRWVVLRIGFFGGAATLFFIDFDGNLQDSETQTLGPTLYEGIFSDGTYIYVVGGGSVQRRTYTSTTFSTFISSLGSGTFTGGAATSDRFILANNRFDTAVFYNHSGTLQSSEQISLPSGAYRAVVALEIPMPRSPSRQPKPTDAAAYLSRLLLIPILTSLILSSAIFLLQMERRATS